MSDRSYFKQSLLFCFALKFVAILFSATGSVAASDLELQLELSLTLLSDSSSSRVYLAPTTY
jgi:hypothetical protein